MAQANQGIELDVFFVAPLMPIVLGQERKQNDETTHIRQRDSLDTNCDVEHLSASQYSEPQQPDGKRNNGEESPSGPTSVCDAVHGPADYHCVWYSHAQRAELGTVPLRRLERHRFRDWRSDVSDESGDDSWARRLCSRYVLSISSETQ